MPARNVECQCTYNFTCKYCLQNAKPYFFTTESGFAIYETRVWGRNTSAKENSDDLNSTGS